jgi:hypothetical protein
VFIIVAESGAEDKETGLVSLYKVLEKFQIAPIPTPKPGELPPVVLWPGFRVVATWMRSPGDDPGHDYEYEFLLIMPTNQKVVHVSKGTFRFTAPLHRFTLRFPVPVPLEGTGVLHVVNKIRKGGSNEDWVSQDYPVIVEALPGEKADAPPSEQTS